MLSLLLCTHQPRDAHLQATLAALREQTLSLANWELVLVDNASEPTISEAWLDWHPQGRVIREQRLGLARARATGIRAARGELLVFCDDDNVLDPEYLGRARQLFAEDPALGAAGGKCLARYAQAPPTWLGPFADRLALRDFGDERLVASWSPTAGPRTYPPFAPVGAGLIIRRQIALAYADRWEKSPVISDRVGTQLSSGGDSDLVLTALSGGWAVGYFPELQLHHLIPAERMRLTYLARLNRASSESWVRLLARHGLCPWSRIPRWTLGLRQARAFFVQRAWRGPAAYLNWVDACGLFAGRARLPRLQAAPKSCSTSPGP